MPDVASFWIDAQSSGVPASVISGIPHNVVAAYEKYSRIAPSLSISTIGLGADFNIELMRGLFERRGEPYNKSLDYKAGAGREWKQFHMPFVADWAQFTDYFARMQQFGIVAGPVVQRVFRLKNARAAIEETGTFTRTYGSETVGG